MKITEEEYLKAKKITEDYEKQTPTIIVGVLSYHLTDFLLFKYSLCPSKNCLLNHKQFEYLNKIYYCIENECDLCGVCFDEILETDAARQRPDYEEISYNMKMNLKPL